MSQPAPEPVPPNGRVISPSLTALRQCMVLQLLEINRPVCFLPIYWGDSPISSQRCQCECPDGGQGEGWIRLVRVDQVALPGATGRNRSGYLPENCAESALDVVIEMGVWRCAPALDVEPPADGVYDENTFGMIDDMAALQRAWRCCDWFDKRGIRRQFNQSIPLGPQGGCVGVSVMGRAQLSNCVPCPPEEA